MTKRSETGALGEDLATKNLLKKGYKIIERNYREKWGEIDIICINPENVLVFVEVKTVNKGIFTPEDQMTKSKLNKVARTAEIYSKMFYVKHRCDEIRIDLIGITIEADKAKLKHYQGIA
ncbi:MAG TPA: YraN family protein [Candidatus Paceibacterota bacterium]